jgi:quinol monooxygenase YgiN
MIGVIAILRVKPGGGPGFEAVFRELAEQVRANEPDNVIYDLFRSRTEADTYKVLEIYQDEAALVAHRESTHFQTIVPKMGEFREGRPEVEYLDGTG